MATTKTKTEIGRARYAEVALSAEIVDAEGLNFSSRGKFTIWKNMIHRIAGLGPGQAIKLNMEKIPGPLYIAARKCKMVLQSSHQNGFLYVRQAPKPDDAT